MKLKDKFITEFDGKGKVLSALLGVLTLFAILGQIAPGMYNRMPAYAEWICGLTTWSAYNKQADMNIVQMALIGLPVLILLFGAIYVWWNKGAGARAKEAGISFVITYIAVLCMFYLQKESALQWLLLWGCSFAGYCILSGKKETEVFPDLVEKSVLTILATASVFLCLSFFSGAVGRFRDYASEATMIAGGVVFFLLVLSKPCRERRFMLTWLQLLIPFAWLGFIHFRYRYEKDSALIDLFYSGRWKWMCVLLCVFFLFCAIMEIRKKRNTLLFSTVITASVIRIFSQPDGMLNIDYFHNGEITMPMQQLVSFGKVPYKDIIPIHGMCDYYYGLINYLFFDGTYLSLNAAKVVGNILMAVVLATVIMVFVENRRHAFAIVWFFMPFMINGAGMRYWFMFILFFVLFSGRMVKGLQSLYAWILLSIAAIAWNASIGGAAALSFLPVIVYRVCRDFPAQWKALCDSKEKLKRNLTWCAWGALLIVGVSFLPLFLSIVSYLKENTGTTLYVNGMEMLSEVSEATGYFVPGLLNSQGDFWMVTFAFLIPLIVTFGMMFRREKMGAGEMFVTYLLAFWVLANYAFVRYDEGLRAGVLGIFFLFFTAMTLLWSGRKSEVMPQMKNVLTGLYATMIALAALLADDAPFVTSDTLAFEREVPEYVETVIMGRKIEDPVVHVSGDLVSMPNLGTGFIQGNTLASLQNVHALVDAAEQKGKTVFDITNAVANTVLLDMPLYLPYSSAYNISNAMMQEKAIAMLEEKLPDIILAAPEIRFDDAPFSYRCMKLYRYLMTKDYVPYKYENVIYLARGENPLPQAAQDWEAFAQLMHKKDIAYLPAVWGSNAEQMAEPLEEIKVTTRAEEMENGVRIVFDHPVPTDQLSMIGISGLCEAIKGEAIADDREKAGADEVTRVTMTTASGLADGEIVEFVFSLKGDRYLIPVCCSPYVTQKEYIDYIELTSESWENLTAQQMKIQLYK